MEWFSGSETYTAYPMVCFCDIPLSRIDDHVGFYGSFGIGVTRRWAISNGLSPVLYLNNNSHQKSAFKNFFTNNLNGKEIYKGSYADHNNLMSSIKPVEGRMLINREVISKEFYQESEWRFVVCDSSAGLKPFMYKRDFENIEELNTENIKSKKHHSLKISPSDISYIFVKSESDIPSLVNFIQTELDIYSGADIKILLTRIVSMETIRRDL
jgi:hypothetical protein